MNLLINTAPDYIVIRGKKIKINTSFNVWVEFFISCKEKNEKKVMKSLTKIFKKLPECNANELISECIKWIHGENGTNEKRTESKVKNSSDPFDFEIDGNVIYCELWEYFPHLMKRGISYHEGIELIKILIHNDKTMLWHRAFARVGDFSNMSKEQKTYWQKQRAIYVIPNAIQQDIDDVFSNAF